MKKIFLAFVITASLSIVSCNIDKTPYDSITSDDLLNSSSSVESVTIGNYSRLKAWSADWHRLTEYPGDNVSLSGTTTNPLFFLYNYQRIPNNDRVDGFWKSSYQIIVGANKVIESIASGESPEKDQILAENYYLRAMVHFFLVNVFGKPYSVDKEALGVPLKLDGDFQNHPERSTVSQVYDQIEKDLLLSLELYTAEKTNAYASKEASNALLSRIYLYKEDNQKAIEYADKVINSGRFNLLSTSSFPDYVKLQPETNKETIFEIRFVKDADYAANNGRTTIGSMYATIKGAGYGEMYASRSYLELIRTYPEDVRNQFILPSVVDASITWALYVDDTYKYIMKEVTKSGDDYSYQENGQSKALIKESNGSGDYLYYILDGVKKRRVLIDKKLELRNGYPKYFVLKASGQEDQIHLWSPVVSRLAEMYLNRAEANAKLGNTPAALSDVNLIRERAGIPSTGLYNTSNLNGKSVLDIVLEERRLEFAFEGHRKFDVYRNKETMNRKYPGTHLSGVSPVTEIPYTDKAIVEYLPESQILVQENLIQNP